MKTPSRPPKVFLLMVSAVASICPARYDTTSMTIMGVLDVVSLCEILDKLSDVCAVFLLSYCCSMHTGSK